MISDFVVFIITHKRANNVLTYETLRKNNYTGEIYLIIDNLDTQRAEYINKFGEKYIIIFNKQEIANTTDQGDNFNDLRTTTHARNACYDIAKNLGYTYFLVLDDDYSGFRYRFINERWLTNSIAINGYGVKNLDLLFNVYLNFYKSINVKCIAMAQGGDYIGGEGSGMISNYLNLSRKCMNSWFCSTERPVKFISRLNEDVNTYLLYGSKGDLFLTIPFCGLEQAQTQKNKGGMTETYLINGTYHKSFFTVMYCPSFVKLALMGVTKQRLHYTVSWENAVPRIINEKYKK